MTLRETFGRLLVLCAGLLLASLAMSSTLLSLDISLFRTLALPSGLRASPRCTAGFACPHADVATELWGSPDAGVKALSQSETRGFNINGKAMQIRANSEDWQSGEGEVKKEFEEADSYNLKVLAELRHSECGVVVDIGCNIGMFTMAAFAYNANNIIICIEPMPQTYSYLRWNLEQNQIPLLDVFGLREKLKGWREGERPCNTSGGVLPINGAVASGAGPITVSYNPEHSKNGVTSAVSIGTDEVVLGVTATVPVVKLQDFLSLEDKVVFMKVDCEGCEHAVAPLIAPFMKVARWVAAEIHPCLQGHGCLVDAATVSQTRSLFCGHGCCTDEGNIYSQACHSGDRGSLASR